MFQIMAIGVEGIGGFAPVLPAMLIFHRIMRKKDRAAGISTPKSHVVGTYFFCLLLVAVFAATGLPSLYGLQFDPSINLIPFSHSSYLQYSLNVLLFVPVGFLLPLLWTKFKKKRATILYGALLSLAIELGQLLTFRATDIDDLLLNTAGTAIGCFLFALIKKLFPKISVCAIDGAAHWKYERAIYFCCAWFSLFLVPPVIADFLWSLLPFMYNR
jgi:glycopeptide antibiotics resistance protein